MIPIDPVERDLLAGEYVLGVLDAEQRREIELALGADRELRAAIAFWERKLQPLSALAEPRNPPADIWDAIATRVSPAAGPSRRRTGATPWRWSTAAFAAVAAALLLYVVTVPRTLSPATSPLVAVLQAAGTQNAAWIAVVSRDGLRLSELIGQKPPAARAYELWEIAPHATRPVPLGVIPANGTLQLAALPNGVSAGATLAISIEPPAGSPTGLPTGPVVFAGALHKA